MQGKDLKSESILLSYKLILVVIAQEKALWKAVQDRYMLNRKCKNQ